MKKNVQKTYKTKKQTRISKSSLVITIITLICICINIILVIQNILTPKLEQEQKIEEKKAEQTKTQENVSSEEYQLLLLKQGKERDRMDYYCGQFFKFIEKKNYEKAYNLLYSEFKNEYFPTIEEFTKYVQSLYPSVMAIKYDDIDREGNIYIITAVIDNAFSTDQSEQFKQRIVVKENNYNEYVLSFQVI